MSQLSPNDYRVLIVEDSPIHRRILTSILGGLGYTAVEAESPAAAIRHLQGASFHAVFLDWRFPEDTGKTVTDYLKARRIESRVIITSSDNSPAMLEVFQQSGAHHVIGKRFTPADIRTALSASPSLQGQPGQAESASCAPAYAINAKQRASLEQELNALRCALANKQNADAGRAAHNLHGIAELLGLHPIALLSREVEISIFTGESLETDLVTIEQQLRDLPEV